MVLSPVVVWARYDTPDQASMHEGRTRRSSQFAPARAMALIATVGLLHAQSLDRSTVVPLRYSAENEPVFSWSPGR
jgi:hypothetical protein